MLFKRVLTNGANCMGVGELGRNEFIFNKSKV